MTICREWLIVKSRSSLIEAQPLLCRSWGCEHCAPLRRRQLIAQGAGGNPDMFITLTSNPAYGTSPAHRARMLVVAWRTLRKWAGDLYNNGPIPFLAVFEATKKGEPHLHILCRSKYIDGAWLSRKMNQLTGSPIINIQRLDNPIKAANYVAEYCGKEPHQFGTVKRYWHSQDWECEPYDEDCDGHDERPVIEIWKRGLSRWQDQMTRQGYIVQPTLKGWTAWNPRIFAAQLRTAAQKSAAPPSRPPPYQTTQASNPIGCHWSRNPAACP